MYVGERASSFERKHVPSLESYLYIHPSYLFCGTDFMYPLQVENLMFALKAIGRLDDGYVLHGSMRKQILVLVIGMEGHKRKP